MFVYCERKDKEIENFDGGKFCNKFRCHFFFLTLIRYFSFWELNDIEIENEVIIKLLIFVLYIL